jgi:hypothetical protein
MAGSGWRIRLQSERIFATKAALTNRLDELRALRSRFGSSDSWFIKARGRHFFAVANQE